MPFLKYACVGPANPCRRLARHTIFTSESVECTKFSKIALIYVHRFSSKKASICSTLYEVTDTVLVVNQMQVP